MFTARFTARFPGRFTARSFTRFTARFAQLADDRVWRSLPDRRDYVAVHANPHEHTAPLGSRPATIGSR